MHKRRVHVRALDIVVLSSDEDDTNPVDDPLLSATNITEGKLHENQVVLNESPTSSSNEASDDFKKSLYYVIKKVPSMPGTCQKLRLVF